MIVVTAYTSKAMDIVAPAKLVHGCAYWVVGQSGLPEEFTFCSTDKYTKWLPKWKNGLLPVAEYRAQKATMVRLRYEYYMSHPNELREKIIQKRDRARTAIMRSFEDHPGIAWQV